MKVDRKYIEGANKKQYLEYLKLFATFKEDKTQKYTMLILTFLTMSFFGIFAVNPTLTTIAGLQKTLEDARYVDERLTTKINNLRLLGERYNQLAPDLPSIFSAIPETPTIVQLLGQVQGLAKTTGVVVTSVETRNIPLAAATKLPPKNYEIDFTIEVSGDYAKISNFLSQLTIMERIVTVEGFSLVRDPGNTTLLLLIVNGTGYFRE